MDAEQVEPELPDRGPDAGNLAFRCRACTVEHRLRDGVGIARQVDEEHTDDGEHEEEITDPKQPSFSRTPPAGRECWYHILTRSVLGRNPLFDWKRGSEQA